ncbi:MAG: sugar ABC transporter permease [Propionibacteriaceae bacterium]|nr:sugar ABC transporter permease [Micropruina sp.]HBX81066.1 ABC transporter permease [Propionibacteriaceae bacterium]HBY24704.1 ABC transporter permease [Propionibacteriaceae bacterium]
MVRSWKRSDLVGLVYTGPAGLVALVLFGIPIVVAFYMSLTDWPLIGNPRFVGLQQYQAIGSNDLLMSSIPFTLVYTAAATTAFFVVALGLALFVQDAKRGVGLFRTAFFLPSVVGVTSATLLFYAMYNNEYGPLDDLLRAVGLAHGDVDFLGTQGSAFASTLVLTTWRYAGFNMLLLLTGLQAIPKDLYEAAAVDGASRWRVFTQITLPLLRPSIALMLILTVTGSLLVFEPFFVLTAGGPDNSTVTVVMAMFREAFTKFDLGAAAAISVVILIALVILNSLQFVALRKED